MFFRSTDIPQYLRKYFARPKPCNRCYICHIRMLFSEMKRVLRDDGTIWWNIGDSFSGSGGGNYGSGISTRLGRTTEKFHPESGKDKPKGELPPQNMMGIPWRTALAVQADGWWLRDNIVWCLSSDTPMVAKVDDKIWFGTLEELYKKDSDKIELRTLTHDGHKTWIKVTNINYNGTQKCKEITLTNGLKVIASENHEFPIKQAPLRRNSKYLTRIKMKKVIDLDKNDRFYVASDLNISIGGSNDDYKDGYWIGFYLAEGHKDSKKGYVYLTCGVKDLPILNKFQTWGINLNIKPRKNRDGSTLDVRLYIRGAGRRWRDLIYDNVYGNNAREKLLNNDIFNKSSQFLVGLMEGYLDGDGHYTDGRWRVGICDNKNLVRQMNLIAMLIGKEFREEKITDVHSFGKTYKSRRFTIKEYSHGTYKKSKGKVIFGGGLFVRKIRSIKDIGLIPVFDVSVEPLYRGGWKNQYNRNNSGLSPSNEKRDSLNHLYFLGNGILTHNSKGMSFCPGFVGSVMPESVKNRTTRSHENIFMFAKNRDYFYDNEAVKEKGTYPAGTKAAKGSKVRNLEFGVNARPDEYAVYDGKRNLRNVWCIPTTPSRTGHFASFPLKLPETCIKAATSEYGVCAKCGSPWQRIVEKNRIQTRENIDVPTDEFGMVHKDPGRHVTETSTKGWEPTCDCESTEVVPATVLDPFSGTATTGEAALSLNRSYIGLELNEKYVKISEDRLSKWKLQKKLF